MCSLRQDYDVAVLDEIQMIGDPERGHAWTRCVSLCPSSFVFVLDPHTIFADFPFVGPFAPIYLFLHAPSHSPLL